MKKLYEETFDSKFYAKLSKECPEGLTIRQLVVDYVKSLAAKGEPVRSQLEGRIILEQP